ncbi:MAG TPA: polysaccharide biosynthesis tyrosine autokinase [Candidatus Polarisedimenticolia bacterium]|jgi:capsular exopolysaccharide synthesis family protein
MDPQLTQHDAVAERSLLEYGHLLLKRRWAVYASVGLVMTLVSIATFTMKPVYRATAIVQIEKDNPNILSFQDIFAIDNRDELFYQTQYRLMQSRTVARRVLAGLGATAGGAAEPRAGLVTRGKDALKRLLGRPVGPAEGIDPETRLVDGFLSRIRVEPYRNSRLVAISFLDGDPLRAAETANAIATAYIDFNLEAKYSTTEEAAGFLSRQIESLKHEIEGAEKTLQSYGADNQIVALKEGEGIAAKNLSDFNTSFTAAQTDRIRKETRFRSLQDAPLDSIPEVVENPVVRDLKVNYAQLERAYSQKTKTYKPEWPEMVRLRSEMERAREMLGAESREVQAKLLQAARSDYVEALQQEKAMGLALEAQKAETVRVNRGSIQFGNLKMEVDNKRNLLRTLLERQSETGLSARLRGLKSSNVRVVDAAEVPAFPYRPRVQINLLMGLLMGLALGIGMAFFLDHLDRSIKSVDDLTTYIRLPAFGLIPPFRQSGHHYGEASEANPGPGESDSPPGPRDMEGPAEIVVVSRPRSAVAEAYRSLRTSLLLSSAEKAPRLLLITSSHPGEGKTVTAVNTAAALVQAGRKVLLVDCDLRKPRLHKVLGLENSVGLTSCLTGNAELAQAILETRVIGMDLLPSGAIPPNPSELLDSRAFDRLLARVLENGTYDHVILDSPPVLMVTDAQILASKVDGVMLVVRASLAPREAVRLAAESLRRAKGNVLGALLNDAEISVGRSYRYGYRYGQGYGYGYGYGSGRKGDSGKDAGAKPFAAPARSWSARLTKLRGRARRAL